MAGIEHAAGQFLDFESGFAWVFLDGKKRWLRRRDNDE